MSFLKNPMDIFSYFGISPGYICGQVTLFLFADQRTMNIIVNTLREFDCYNCIIPTLNGELMVPFPNNNNCQAEYQIYQMIVADSDYTNILQCLISKKLLKKEASDTIKQLIKRSIIH